jgi:hypothetical protein
MRSSPMLTSVVATSCHADSARGFPKMSFAYAAGLKVGKGKVSRLSICLQWVLLWDVFWDAAAS